MAVPSINSRKSSDWYSCGIDAFLDCLYYAIPTSTFVDSVHHTELDKLLKTYHYKRTSDPTNQNFLCDIRDDIWGFARNKLDSFKTPWLANACLPDLLPEVGLSRMLFPSRFHCEHCNQELHRVVPMSHVTLLNEQFLESSGNLETVINKHLRQICRYCREEFQISGLPETLCIYDAFGNTPRSTVISEIMSLHGTAFRLDGTIRWLPGHFTSQVRFQRQWYNLDDMLDISSVRSYSTLSSILGHGESVEFKGTEQDRLIVFIYNKLEDTDPFSSFTLPKNKCHVNAVKKDHHLPTPKRSSLTRDPDDCPRPVKKVSKNDTPKMPRGVSATTTVDSGTGSSTLPFTLLLEFCPQLKKDAESRGYGYAVRNFVNKPTTIKSGPKIVAIPREDFYKILLAAGDNCLSNDGINFKNELIQKLIVKDDQGKCKDENYLSSSELWADKSNPDYDFLLHARSEKLEESLQRTRTSIAHGGKKALLDQLKHLVHVYSKNKKKEETITINDLLSVCANEKESPCYLSAEDILYATGNFSDTEMVGIFREKLGPMISTPRDMDIFKRRTSEEFIALLRPRRVNLGWRIDPLRLHYVLGLLYYYLPNQEWIRLYGDARTFGRQQTTVITFSFINDEMALHNNKFQSPKELYTLCVFYGKDSRHALEMNIGDGFGGPGWLNAFIEGTKKEHRVFLTGDAVFEDGVVGPREQFSGLSKTGFNIFSSVKYETKGDVDSKTGFRSTLEVPVLDRDEEMSQSLLPALRTKDAEIVLCIDHGITRIVERVITRFGKDIAEIPSIMPGPVGVEKRKSSLEFLTNNINKRGVKSGNFCFHFNEQWVMQDDVSFNKSDAQAIIALPEKFEGCENYPAIMENVSLDRNWPTPVDQHLAQALKLPSSTRYISQFKLENQILVRLGFMYEILRKEKELIPKNESKKNSSQINRENPTIQLSERPRLLRRKWLSLTDAERDAHTKDAREDFTEWQQRAIDRRLVRDALSPPKAPELIAGTKRLHPSRLKFHQIGP